MSRGADRPGVGTTPAPQRPLWSVALQLAAWCGLAALAAVSTDQVLRVKRARRDAEATRLRRPYQYRALRAQRRVLVMGDSTGVGIGADCGTQSIAGLLAADYRGAEVVNLSVSGSTLADVPAQLRQLPSAPDAASRFDVLLLHVGGNDILHSPNLAAMRRAAETLLPMLHRVARRVIWLGPGDVGLAPLFRPPFSWWISRRTRQACAMFAQIAREHGTEFVGFHDGEHRLALVRERAQYFAGDGFHPNSHGYRYCYQWLSRQMAMPPATARRQRALSHAEHPPPIERWPNAPLRGRAGTTLEQAPARASPGPAPGGLLP
ncbi:GDSL-type esterase/lipase family protein [Ideonella sp. DXS29W]|uniref:GDSL-type esterase/lipase family protein n=1 Tax=Ideonella lacteola TaxID=2984193 RepID=A0ABU9BS61_9BURK